MGNVRPSRALLVMLVVLTALGEGSTQILLPALPQAATALHSTPAAIQSSFSAFAIALGLGQLVVGPMADRFGRKPLLLAGLMLFVLGSLGCLAAGQIEHLVLARMLQGLGASAGVVGARTIVRDVWGPEAPRAMALLVFGMMVMLMLAPMLGGHLSGLFGWRTVFTATAAAGLAAGLAVVVGLGETRPSGTVPVSVRGAASAYGELLTHRGYHAYTLALGSSYGVLFVYVSQGGFVLTQQFGLTTAGAGAASGLVFVGLVAGTLAASRWVPKLGPARLVSLGTMAVLVGALLALVTASSGALVLFLGPQLIITLGAGLVLPSAVGGAVMPFGARAGLAAGFLGFAQMVLGAAFVFLLAAISDGSAWPMLLVQAIAAAVAFVSFQVLQPRAVSATLTS